MVLADESVAFAAARFRPQQTKRLGPGLLAAEIELPAAEVAAFLAGAARLARGAGVALEHEVYFLSGERALVIAGYLTDHRSAAFLPDLALTPALLDLAVRRHGGRPYVLGRWQACFASDKFGARALPACGRSRPRSTPTACWAAACCSGFRLRGPLGRMVARVYRPGVRLMGACLAHAWSGRGAATGEAALRVVPGPGHRRGRGRRAHGASLGPARPRSARPLPSRARAGPLARRCTA